MFDIILSNPPYSYVGADITANIIKNVGFKRYINLMPAVDYKKYPNLFKHVRPEDLTNLSGGFDDAVVTSSIGEVYKDRVNNLSEFQFTLKIYLDRSLDKYFLENSKRKFRYYSTEKNNVGEIDKTLFLPLRINITSGITSCAPDKVSLNRTADSAFYKVAHNKIKSWAELRNEGSLLVGTRILFNSPVEKQNAVSYIYTPEGFKFASKCFYSMQRDQFHRLDHLVWFPHVDWSKKWTLKDILKEYNYTQAEIELILKDLQTPNKYLMYDND